MQRRSAVVLLVLGLTLPALGAGRSGRIPRPGATISNWEVPCQHVLPVQPLLDQGLAVIEGVGADGSLNVTLLDLATGKTRWSVPVASDLEAANLAGDVVLVASHEQVLGISLAEGKRLWSQPIARPIDNGWLAYLGSSAWDNTYFNRALPGQGPGGGMLVIGDRFFLCVQSVVFAVRADTGEVIWQRKIEQALASPLQAFRGNVLLAPVFGDLALLAAKDGSVIWTQPLQHAKPYQVGDELYVSGQLKGLFRFDPANGSILWHAEVPDSYARVYVSGDRVALAHGSQGNIYILSHETGQVLWQQPDWVELALFGDGLIFHRTGIHDGGVTCRRIADAGAQWSIKLPHLPPDFLYLDGTRLLMLRQQGLVCADARSGSSPWAQFVGDGIAVDMYARAYDDKGVYINAYDSIRGYDLATGRWVLYYPRERGESYWMHIWHDTLFVHGVSKDKGVLWSLPLTWLAERPAAE